MVKSKISGETSWKETGFGILPRSKVIQLEAQGTKKGLLLLNQIAQKQNPLSIELIKRIHKVSFEDILQTHAGVFRTVQVEYSGKETPHFFKVHEMMQNLIDDTEHVVANLPTETSEEYIKNIVDLLAIFQHRFVVIHPFVDYNGRLSRMFTNYLLMRVLLPAIEIPVTTVSLRRKYIHALQKADDGEYGSLQNIISIALNESLVKLQR